MYIGLLEVSGRVALSTSLKDKRRVIQRCLDRARNQFNLSVAEVEHQDDRQMTQLAFVGVGSNRQTVENQLNQVIDLIELLDELEIHRADISFV